MSTDKGIVIVNDRPQSTQAVEEMLASQGFSNVYQAFDMAQCLSILSEQAGSIYLIILDLKIPEDSALAIMQYISIFHQHMVGMMLVNTSKETSEAEYAKAHFIRLGICNVIPAEYMLNTSVSRSSFYIEVARIVELIDKRIILGDQMWNRLDSTDFRVSAISNMMTRLEWVTAPEHELSRLDSRLLSFVKSLGMDVIQAVIVRLAVLASQYLFF